jgi:HK97 family phage major capsid protein
MKRFNTLGLQIAALLASAPALALRNDLTGDARELMAAITAKTDEVKNLALDAQKGNGELSAAFKAKADADLTAQAEMRAQLTELQQHIAAQLPANQAAAQTLGERFTNEARVAEFIAAGLSGNDSTGKIRATFKGETLRNAVSSGAASAGALKTPQILPGILAPGMQRLTIRDLLTWGRTTQSSVEFFKELAFTNNAAPVSELVKKPESNLTFEAATAPVITVAHWLKASKQILADVPQLQSYIDGRLRYGLKLKEEAQLLKGSGVGINLNGLYTAASAYSNPGVTVVSENRMDRLRIAILQAELSGYYADGIVLSPIDWTQIELSKTASDKNYLVGNPFGGIAPTLWGRPVVASQSMTAGQYLVGAFGIAAQGWDREEMTVQLGYENDDFTKNAITVLCEERLALSIFRADALIKGSFGSVA